jgi:hypothetical protein
MREQDVDDDFDLDDEDEPSRRRRLTYVGMAAGVLAVAIVAAVLVVRQQAVANAPTFTVTSRLVELPTTGSVNPESFACPETGRGPVPWTSAVKPSSSSGAGSGQLAAALVTIVSPPNAKDVTDVAATVWLSTASNQTRIGFVKDAPLCAFVDTGALASNLEQSASATASAEPLSSTANLKIAKPGTPYALDVKGLEPGRSAIVVLVGRLAEFTGPAAGTLEAKVLSIEPTLPEARVTPGGRDARISVGDRGESGAVALALESDRELWTRGQPVQIRLRLSNTYTDAVVGSVSAQFRIEGGLTQLQVGVRDGAGVPTACTNEGTVFTCRTDYLSAAEEVTVTVDAVVAQDAVSQFTAKGASCPPRATDICVRAQVTGVAGQSGDFADAALAGNVAADTALGITKLPAGVADHVRAGVLTRFVYLVSANPGLSLKEVRLTDPGCSSPEFVGGDKNINELLDGGETWQYECIAGAPRSADVEITVSATTSNGNESVKASGQLAVPVYAPAIELRTPQPGEPIVEMVNTGNVTLRGVAVVGRGCEVPPDVVVSPGATLRLTCRSTAGTLRVFAVDPSGDAVTALDEAPAAGP